MFRKHPEENRYIYYSPSIPLGKLGIQIIGVVSGIAGKWVWIIIGGNELYDQKGKYVEYPNIRPVKRIGKGVFIFYLI
ncbi:MAG: hypothetical protein LBE12_10255 [Planctomycetaceae bacterium]|nr:hypothetical protein [Planctomycetaceae bacterium]